MADRHGGGELRISAELLVRWLGLPEGTAIVGAYGPGALGVMGLLVEGPWLPWSAGWPPIEAVYHTDRIRGTVQGRFTCGGVQRDGPKIPTPPATPQEEAG